MPRYEREYDKWAGLPWTERWRAYRVSWSSSAEATMVHTLHGSASLERFPAECDSVGYVTAAMRGKVHNLTIQPCPTRVGLVRMAVRQMREWAQQT